MQITVYPKNLDVNTTLQSGGVLIAAISFDGARAIAGDIDECMEHHILLSKSELPALDIDKYFRIIFDRESADWTFVYPPDYKNITDKTRRITAFYRDGFGVISTFMAELGLFADIKIPKRYKRHINAIS